MDIHGTVCRRVLKKTCGKKQLLVGFTVNEDEAAHGAEANVSLTLRNSARQGSCQYSRQPQRKPWARSQGGG